MFGLLKNTLPSYDIIHVKNTLPSYDIIHESITHKQFKGDKNQFIQNSKKINRDSINDIRAACNFLLLGCSSNIKKYTKEDVDQYIDYLIKTFYPDQIEKRYLFIDIVSKILKARSIVLQEKSFKKINDGYNEAKDDPDDLANTDDTIKNVEWKYTMITDDLTQLTQTDKYIHYQLPEEEKSIETQKNNDSQHKDPFSLYIFKYFFLKNEEIQNSNSTKIKIKEICKALKNGKKCIGTNLYDILFDDKKNKLKDDETLVKIVFLKTEKDLDYLEDCHIAWFADQSNNYKIQLNKKHKFPKKNDLEIKKNTNNINKIKNRFKKHKNNQHEINQNTINEINQLNLMLNKNETQNNKNLQDIKNELNKTNSNIKNELNEINRNINQQVLKFFEKNYKEQILKNTKEQTNQIKENLFHEQKRAIDKIKNSNDQLHKSFQNELKNVHIQVTQLNKIILKLQNNIKSLNAKNNILLKVNRINDIKLFILGIITISISTYLIGKSSHDYGLGLSIGVILFLAWIIIFIFNWKNNTENNKCIPIVEEKMNLSINYD